MGVPVDAVTESDGTIGGTHYAEDDLLGPYPLPFYGWGRAGQVAEGEADQLGYGLSYNEPHEYVGDEASGGGT